MILECKTPWNHLKTTPYDMSKADSTEDNLLEALTRKKPLSPVDSDSLTPLPALPLKVSRWHQQEKSTLVFIRHISRDDLNDEDLSDLDSDSSQDSSTRIKNQNLRNEIRRNQAANNNSSIVSGPLSILNDDFVVAFLKRDDASFRCNDQYDYDGGSMSSLSCVSDDDSCFSGLDLDSGDT